MVACCVLAVLVIGCLVSFEGSIVGCQSEKDRQVKCSGHRGSRECAGRRASVRSATQVDDCYMNRPFVSPVRMASTDSYSYKSTDKNWATAFQTSSSQINS